MSVIGDLKGIVSKKIDSANDFNTKRAYEFVDVAVKELKSALENWEYKAGNSNYDDIVVYQFFRHDDDVDVAGYTSHARHQRLKITKDWGDCIVNIKRDDEGKNCYIIAYSNDLPDSKITIDEIFSNKGIDVIIQDFGNDDIIYNRADLKEYSAFKSLRDRGRLIELTFPFKQFLP